MNEASLRILAAMRLINETFGKPVEGKWAVATNLKQEAWDRLYDAWCAVNEFDEDNDEAYRGWTQAWKLVAGAGYSKDGDVIYYD